ILSQPGIEFDARRFEFVGAAVKEDIVCALTKASGITTVEQWMAAKTPVKLGGNAPGVTPDNAGRILKAALGLPIQVVSGYKGTADIRLAADSGELAGGCWSWESMRTTWRSALSAATVVAVVQLTARGFPDLAGVPLAISLAKTDEARRLIELGAHHASAYARPFLLAPDPPAPDTVHRRGDRGRRRGVSYGLRVGLDRPPSPVASYWVASAVADARPPGPGDGPDATQNVDAAAPAGQAGGRGREHRHPRSHHARAPRRGCVRRLPGAGAGDGGARPPGPRAEARGVARADEATLGRRGGDARGALHAGHG